jgi:hypothetical protein
MTLLIQTYNQILFWLSPCYRSATNPEVILSKRGILFFATGNDLRLKLKSIESNRRIKYVRCGMYDSENYPVYNTVDDFPNLGISTSGEHTDGAFLVLDYNTDIILREVKQLSGGVKYPIDQRENSASIALWPGGLYGSDYIIHGRITTVHDEASKDLYGYFVKNFTKGFEKHQEFYIGSEALKLAEKIRMITININEPVEYDLKTGTDR